jgi:decaprenylphospho-beta-D-ribofuranose 2-oxidase
LGRSYGDAAQCAGGTVIDTRCFDAIGPIDPETGMVTLGGGVRLGDVINRSLSAGWFIPVTPGTRHVTIGGAIAADIHGKNHHRDGSFCSHVTNLVLMTPTGTHSVSASSDPALFWATAGGMGLTGVIVEATVRLTPVASSWLSVDTEKFEDVHDLMATMEASDQDYRYSVAWVDCTDKGGVGRSVLTRGDHASPSVLGRRSVDVALREPRLGLPGVAPAGLMNGVTLRAGNELWYRRGPRRSFGDLQSVASFFYPLDAVRHWNRLYGPRGFVQYQFVVAPDRAEAIRQAMTMAAARRLPASLAVLKRFGPGNGGPLSFPIEGWTLALDFAVGHPELPPLLARFDELVADAGGRVYLAKDARLRPEYLPVMYPRLPDFEEVRRRVDPEGILRSDLSRRLGFGGAAADE